MLTSRLRRSIQLLMLLRRSDGLALSDLAHWLDCSQRTVYRDLQLLKESGFEVIWSSGGYRIELGEELPPAALDNEELMALLTTISASPLIRNAQTRRHLQCALQKLIAACSPLTRQRWLRLTRHLADQPVSRSTTTALPNSP